MKGKNVLTIGDVARICNVVDRTVTKWFDTGLLKGYIIPGSKDRRILPEDLIEFLKEHKMPYVEAVLEEFLRGKETRGKETRRKEKSILTTGDVARICNITRRIVTKWFDNGLLKGYKIPGRQDRRIFPKDLIEFLREHKMPYEEAVLEEFPQNQKAS